MHLVGSSWILCRFFSGRVMFIFGAHGQSDGAHSLRCSDGFSIFCRWYQIVDFFPLVYLSVVEFVRSVWTISSDTLWFGLRNRIFRSVKPATSLTSRLESWQNPHGRYFPSTVLKLRCSLCFLRNAWKVNWFFGVLGSCLLLSLFLLLLLLLLPLLLDVVVDTAADGCAEIL